MGSARVDCFSHRAERVSRGSGVRDAPIDRGRDCMGALAPGGCAVFSGAARGGYLGLMVGQTDSRFLAALGMTSNREDSRFLAALGMTVSCGGQRIPRCARNDNQPESTADSSLRSE